MNISGDAIIAAVSSFTTGLVVLIVGRFISRGQQEDDQKEKRFSDFQTSIQQELEDVRDESHRNKEEADRYRQLYFTTLEDLHRGNTSESIVNILKDMKTRIDIIERLLIQHLRDGLYVLGAGEEQDSHIKEAFRQLGVELPMVDYQSPLSSNIKDLLDEIDQEKTDEQPGDR